MYIDSYQLNHDVDIKRTVCRKLIYPYRNRDAQPLFFRHYKNEYSGDGDFGSKSGRAHCCIFIYLEGDFNFITNTRIHNMTYGDVFVARENEPFWSNCTTITHFDYYQFDIPPCFFEEIFEADFYKNIFYNREEGKRNYISMPEAKKLSCIDKLKKIEEISKNPKASDAVIFSYITQIISLLNETFTSDSYTDTDRDSPRCVIDAIKYIKKNYAVICGINEVADHVGTSPSYLCRAFKKSVGCTVMEYVKILKITFSKHLLENGRNVTDACYESGFNSYSYFIQTFRDVVGTTPFKYKKLFE